MIVVEAVILTNFPNKVLDLIPCGYEERLFQLKELLFHVLGQLNLEITRLCY
jgi:hypothetical protein